jgi:hydroxymethylpyrimidine pyrophosphatase-like HAD family hydrolase
MPTETIFVDIDGTLTEHPMAPWGLPRVDVINKIKSLIAEGHEIVLWSAGGTQYAKDFAERYGIKPLVCVGKPRLAIDDKSDIRSGGIWVGSAEELLEIGVAGLLTKNIKKWEAAKNEHDKEV